MAGVPGIADMVNVDVPRAIAAGISRCGMFAARNNSRAIGAKTKKATKRLTPPYVTSAPASTTARIARRCPSLALMKWAMAWTDPLSSMSLPNSAPSRNIGKNCAMNCAALPMNVCVQWASRGSPAKAAATIATAGARRSTLHPRNESQISRPRATRIPSRPMASNLLQEDIQIDRGALADVVAVGCEEALGGTAAFVPQHAKEIPFGVELRRCAELGQSLAGDEMNAHLGPFATLGAPGVRDLPQQRDHAQLLEQRGVERDLVQPIEDLTRGARRPGSFDRVDGDEKRVVRVALAHERRDRRVAGVAAIPIGRAIDLDRTEERRQAGGGEQDVGCQLGVAKHAPAAGVNVGRRHEQPDRGARDLGKIDRVDEDLVQRVSAGKFH